jgi:hypothetical protein
MFPIHTWLSILHGVLVGAGSISISCNVGCQHYVHLSIWMEGGKDLLLKAHGVNLPLRT